MNPLVKNYLGSKFGLLNPEDQDQLNAPIPESIEDLKSNEAQISSPSIEPSDQSMSFPWAQVAAGVGATLAGRSPSESANAFDQMRQRSEDTDPMSRKSKVFRKMIESQFPDIANRYGDIWQDVTASDIDVIFKPLQLGENIEQRKEQAKLLSESGYARVGNELIKLEDLKRGREEQLALEREKIRSRERIEGKKIEGQKAREANKTLRPSDAQIKEISEFDDTVNKTQSALDLLGDKKDWVGQVDARIPDMFVGADQVAFRAAIGRMSDAYRKLITGAGASNLELQRLESRLPKSTDTYENFVSKAKGFMNEIKQARSTHLSNLQKAGKNVGAFAEGSGKKVVSKQYSQSRNQTKITYDDGTTEIKQGK